MQMQGPVHPMAGPVIVGLQFGLDPAGGLQERGEMYGMGCVHPCLLAGRWNYDPSRRIFSIQVMINGAPPAFTQSYQLVERGNGSYTAVTPQDTRFSVQRVS